MGFIPSLLSNDSGAGFKAKPSVLTAPVSLDNGINAQNHAGLGLDQQQAFLQALQGQGGLANQAAVFAQQQALANQLQSQANGEGPNPAQQALQNATGQNVSQQAALQAGQRGASANVGLMARQIGQNGAGIQQQAAGQSALMQAQQQIAAQQALQQQQAMMGQLAGNQVGQQSNALSNYNQFALNNQGQVFGQINNQNQNNIADTSQQNTVNAGIAKGNQAGQSQMFSGLMGGLGVGAQQVVAGQMGGGGAAAGGGGISSMAPGAVGSSGAGAASALALAKGGEVPSGPRSNAAQYLCGLMPEAKGGTIDGEQLASMGLKVPGKASVKGDSLKNDTVNARLSPGEIVVPRSHASNPKAAADFAYAVAMKSKGKK